MSTNGYVITEHADLRDADLSGTDLTGKNASWANLSGADLSNATLVRVDFNWAILLETDLSGADLDEADFSYATLTYVDMTSAKNLDKADFYGAFIDYIDFSCASFLDGYPLARELSSAETLRNVTISGTLEKLQNLIGDSWRSFDLISGVTTLTISDINDYTNADIVALQASTSASVTDTLNPALEAAFTDTTGTVITLEFDENLNVVDIPADQFEVSSEREVEIESVSILNDTITLNISSDTPIQDVDNVTVSYSGTSITDASGNSAALSAQDITNNSTIDSVAPTFTGAETSTNGKAVCLRFSEELSSDLAEASAFKVTVDGKASSVASVDITGEDGSSVLLTLTDYIKKGQTVTVSYSDPTFEDDANALQDLIGNDVESLSNKAVTNKSTRGDHSEGNDDKKSTPSYKGTKRNDKIKGDNKSNKMYGLKGNDWLYGKLGNDVFNGGKGRDTAQFSSRNNTIKLTTTKWQKTGDGKDRLISIENVNGGGGKDKIIGNKAKNVLNGQKGKDRLYGGKNDDILIGGGGKDKCWGQQGRDTFRIKRGAGYMIVKDFSDGKDRIQLGSGHKGLKLKTRGDDVYVYQRKDLMAVVEDAAGDLTRKGKYLI